MRRKHAVFFAPLNEKCCYPTKMVAAKNVLVPSRRLHAKGVAYLWIEEKVEENDEGNDDPDDEGENIGMCLKKLWQYNNDVQRCNNDRGPERPSLQHPQSPRKKKCKNAYDQGNASKKSTNDIDGGGYHCMSIDVHLMADEKRGCQNQYAKDNLQYSLYS
jgi:hypothetical protein